MDKFFVLERKDYMKNRLLLILTIIFFLSCEKEKVENPDEKYMPTDVMVKIKGYYTIDKVFNFINSFNHEVENIRSQTYTSGLPSDSLQYVLDYLNEKTYTNDGNDWFVNGYLHNQTKVITIIPRLFDMDNTSYQADWLASMNILKLKEETSGETAGCIIFFHVPEGHEKEWVKKFEEYDFVEWADLNHIYEIHPWL
jgi:hypothetical protein